MSYRTIRDITVLTGTTESALRYYDEKGILIPTIKSQKGRREWLYDEEAVKRLRKVLMLKKIGLSVGEIKKMIESGAEGRKMIMEKHLDTLRERRDEIDRKIAAGELVRMIDELAKDDTELHRVLLEKTTDIYIGKQEADSGGEDAEEGGNEL